MSAAPFTAPQIRLGDVGGLRPSGLTIGLFLALQATTARADDTSSVVEFDRRALINRGLDPALADLFREAPRFAPGRQQVTVTLNGRPRGTVELDFDREGAVLLDMRALRALGLHEPDSMDGKAGDSLFPLLQAWPQAVVRADTAMQRLDLVIPAWAVDDRGEDASYVQGGSAALLNYDVSAFTSHRDAHTATDYRALTETGFNVANWAVRSRQSFQRSRAGTTFAMLGTQAQRSLTERGQLLQLGEISLENPLFAGTPLLGAQLTPEALLQADLGGSNEAMVEGVAVGEARVDILQGGIVIHSTLVPPGPFVLGGFTPRDATTDLEVVIHEQDGERRFLVPASSYRRASLARPGTTLAAGRLPAFVRGPERSDAWLASGSKAWRLPGMDAVASTGVIAGKDYRAVALGLDRALHGTTTAIVSLRSTASQAKREDAQGHSQELRLGVARERLRLDMGAAYRSPSYRDVQDIGWADAATGRHGQWQLSVGTGWSTPRLGAVNLSWSSRHSADGRSGRNATINWSRRFRRSTLAATVQQGQGALARAGRSEKSVHLSWSLPLDRVAVRATARQRNDRQSMSLDLDGRFTPRMDWRMGIEQERSGNDSAQRLSAGTTLRMRGMQMAAAATHSDDATLVSTQLSGGLVAHRHGITLSPERVQDTFGIVRVSREAGVQLTAGGSETWTDSRGFAVLPRVQPYGVTHVQIEGRSLERDVALSNGLQVTRALRGAVPYLSFEAHRTRRVLVKTVDAIGLPLSKGSTVLLDGTFETAVVDGGRIFIADFQPEQSREVVMADGRRCQLQVTVPDRIRSDAFFEDGTGVCPFPSVGGEPTPP